MFKKISLFFKTFAVCLLLSVSAAKANPLSLESGLLNGVVDAVIATADDAIQARGFGGGFGRAAGKGFSMNFGGKGKAGAVNNKNTGANKANAANNTARRSGLMGFFGGLGMMGLMMLGLGIFGGGFILYILAMMIIPLIIGSMKSKQNMQNQEIPTSAYSSDDLFKKNNEEKGNRRF